MAALNHGFVRMLKSCLTAVATPAPFTIAALLPLSAQAAPCYPSDPTGNNPENLCPTFPPPGVNPDTFVQGTARPIRETPSIDQPAGRVLISPTGYYTGIQTSGGVRIITTSTGETIQLRSQ